MYRSRLELELGFSITDSQTLCITSLSHPHEDKRINAFLMAETRSLSVEDMLEFGFGIILADILLKFALGSGDF